MYFSLLPETNFFTWKHFSFVIVHKETLLQHPSIWLFWLVPCPAVDDGRSRVGRVMYVGMATKITTLTGHTVLAISEVVGHIQLRLDRSEAHLDRKYNPLMTSWLTTSKNVKLKRCSLKCNSNTIAVSTVYRTPSVHSLIYQADLITSTSWEVCMYSPSPLHSRTAPHFWGQTICSSRTGGSTARASQS